MAGYISKLHKKSEAARKRFVLIVTGLITLVIILVWASTIDPRVDESKTDTATSVTPFSSVGGTFSEAVKDLMDALPSQEDFGLDLYEELDEILIPTSSPYISEDQYIETDEATSTVEVSGNEQSSLTPGRVVE